MSPFPRISRVIARYTLPAMGDIWTDAARYRRWLDVELAVCEVLHEDGEIPAAEMAAIRERAKVDPAEIEALEEITRHDVIAFVTSVARSIGEAGRHLHRGLTSSDVVDTALSMAMLRGLDVLAVEIERLMQVLRRLALQHAATVMVGRTHGVHAEPTTFGLKMAVWYQELCRHRSRLAAARRSIQVGKLSGAVGAYSGLSPEAERRALARLGLEPALAATQTLQRDRHAEVLGALALTATSLEKFAVEIRHLARTEVREVEEPFFEGQQGSSAMPHKRNPVLSERVSGLARILRGHALAALENVALWHERDISHSSAERVVIPDSFVLLHYQLDTFRGVLEGLRVFPDRMRANMDGTGGLIFSGRVLTALVETGLPREEAYRLVQTHAMAAWEGAPTRFRDRLLSEPAILSALGAEGLAGCFDVSPFLRHVDAVLERALGPAPGG